MKLALLSSLALLLAASASAYPTRPNEYQSKHVAVRCLFFFLKEEAAIEAVQCAKLHVPVWGQRNFAHFCLPPFAPQPLFLNEI